MSIKETLHDLNSVSRIDRSILSRSEIEDRHKATNNIF